MRIFAIAALLCALAVNVTSEPYKASNDNQQSTQPKSPPSVAPENNNVTTNYAEHPNNDAPHWYTPFERPEWWLVLITFLTGLAIAYQAGEMTRSIKEMKASTDIAKTTLVLTQRPRIVVRAFYFSEPTGVGGVYRVPMRIEAGSLCSGQFYIDNCGGTDARIQEIYCTPYIAKYLPMKRPWEGKIGSQERKTIRPGESIPYRFGFSEPLDPRAADDISPLAGNKNFYVLGFVGYKDDLGIYRMTVFCRRYNASKDRFIPVDDSDYEYAD